MAFAVRKDIGRLYVLRIILPDECVVHKIGVTHSDRSVDRMMEILRSWFCKFRFVPYTELKLDMKCHDPHKLETYIHRILKKNQFIPHEKVSGGTEMFTDINETRVISFLKSYNNSQFKEPPKLTDKEYGIICRLLTQ